MSNRNQNRESDSKSNPTSGITKTTSGSSKVKKKLTVDHLNPNNPIYVYNNSKGDHTISVRTGDGGVIPITVPKTFIPVQITEQVAPDVLIRSEDFRKACYRRVLILVSEEEALKKLETKEAVQEIERIRKEANFSGIDYLKNPDDDASILEAAKNTNVEVAVTIKDILIRADLNDDDKISLLTNEDRLGSMEVQDFEYVVTTTEASTKIHKWAVNKLTNQNTQILK